MAIDKDIAMLKSVLQILSFNDKLEPASSAERINCAKIVLKTLCDNIDFDEAQANSKPSKLPNNPNPLKTLTNPQQDSYRVFVDNQNRLEKIENLSLNSDLIVDGKRVKYKDAIGKTFDTITIP